MLLKVVLIFCLIRRSISMTQPSDYGGPRSEFCVKNVSNALFRGYCYGSSQRVDWYYYMVSDMHVALQRLWRPELKTIILRRMPSEMPRMDEINENFTKVTNDLNEAVSKELRKFDENMAKLQEKMTTLTRCSDQISPLEKSNEEMKKSITEWANDRKAINEILKKMPSNPSNMFKILAPLGQLAKVLEDIQAAILDFQDKFEEKENSEYD